MPSAPSAIDRRPIKRIVIRTPNWIGDAVMCLPAVQRIRDLWPEAHIAVICAAKLQDLWHSNPFVNEVITFTDKLDVAGLRAKHFAIAIVFPNSFRSAWEMYRAGIPRRVGFASRWRHMLLTDVVVERREEQPVYKQISVDGQKFRVKHYREIRHQAHHYLDLAAYLGGNPDIVPPKVWVAPGGIPSLGKFLTEGSRPFIGINAGAEFGPAKRWLPERFVAVAAAVAEEIPCRWLIFGGPGDVEIAGQIEAGLRPLLHDERAIINVAGKTSLAELAQLMKFCRVVVTNDTGPMHLAAAVGTPVVAIFGSTSAALTGPLGPHVVTIHDDVECSPCFLRECPIDFRCMKKITPEPVIAAVIKLWNETDKTFVRK